MNSLQFTYNNAYAEEKRVSSHTENRTLKYGTMLTDANENLKRHNHVIQRQLHTHTKQSHQLVPTKIKADFKDRFYHTHSLSLFYL